MFWFSYTDAYSSKDIVYEWIPGEVDVGNKELAQFQYKGAKLTSDLDVFSTGKPLQVDFSSFASSIFFCHLTIYSFNSNHPSIPLSIHPSICPSVHLSSQSVSHLRHSSQKHNILNSERFKFGPNTRTTDILVMLQQTRRWTKQNMDRCIGLAFDSKLQSALIHKWHKNDK